MLCRRSRPGAKWEGFQRRDKAAGYQAQLQVSHQISDPAVEGNGDRHLLHALRYDRVWPPLAAQCIDYDGLPLGLEMITNVAGKGCGAHQSQD